MPTTLMMVIIFILLLFCIFIYGRYKQIRFLYDRNNDISNTMMKVSEELINFQDINELYSQLLEDTINLIKEAETGSILIYNKDRDVMEYKAVKGYELKDLSNVVFKKEELFLYRTKKLLYADIIRDPGSFDKKYVDKRNYTKLKKFNALDIKACLSAPIYINGHFYGIVNVDNKQNENAFNKNDVRLIQYICRQLEVAITNALLMNELMEALRIDKLTGVYNRAYFEELMEMEILKAEGENRPFQLIMIDMDNFKTINDTHGHKMGDEALRYFTKIIKASIGSNDIVARFAGDEFIMVLFDMTTEDARRNVDYIKGYLTNHPYGNLDIQFSAGICQYKRGMNLDKLITIADNNMYKEKKEKKGNI